MNKNTTRTHDGSCHTVRMIGNASRLRQCADARCALATAHGALKQRDDRFVRSRATQTSSANAGAMRVPKRGERRTGGERTWRRGEYAMRCREWWGIGPQGKEDPLVLRSGLPPNRTATVYTGLVVVGLPLPPLSLSLSLLPFPSSSSSLSRETARYRHVLGLLAPILSLFLSRYSRREESEENMLKAHEK